MTLYSVAPRVFHLAVCSVALAILSGCASRPQSLKAANVSPSQPVSTRAVEHFKTAQRLLRAQNIEAAITHFEQAHALGYQDQALYVELTSAYDVTGQYDKAIALYREYLTRHPRDAEMLQQLALTLLLVDQAPEAVQRLEQAVLASPGDAQLQQDLAFAQFKAGLLESALKSTRRALELDPNSQDARALQSQLVRQLKEPKHKP